MRLLILFLLVLYNSALLHALEYEAPDRVLSGYVWESDKFRAMELGEMFVSRDSIDYEELAVKMTEHDFDLTRLRADTGGLSLRFPMRNQTQMLKLAETYRKVFKDLVCFPIPKNRSIFETDITYQNGWMDERTYGGSRGHEGCDLMANQKAPGYYPVVSVSDGVIEKIGWLEKGGYRVGIRAPGGTYFYYAHLDHYAEGLAENGEIKAGELLGFVGDSGYGPEGMTGQFESHLHLGIYIKTEHYAELSVNPYWLLKYLEQYRTSASY